VQDSGFEAAKIIEFRGAEGLRVVPQGLGITREMSMTKALVVTLTVLSLGWTGAAFAAGAASKGGSAAASSSKASASKTSSQSSPAASKAAAKGALNANGPSLDGFAGESLVVSTTDRVLLQQ
jgi:hypothetical protein